MGEACYTLVNHEYPSGDPCDPVHFDFTFVIPESMSRLIDRLSKISPAVMGTVAAECREIEGPDRTWYESTFNALFGSNSEVESDGHAVISWWD